MYDVDAIEAINFEQLATATDRILLRARHSAKRTLARGSQPVMTLDPYETTYVPKRQPARDDDTIITAAPVPQRRYPFASVIVLPALFGIALGLAAML